MLTISRADFSDPALAAFLQEHLDDMQPTAPPESQHALSVDELNQPTVRLWVAHINESLVGTAALAALASRHEELKSMRTDPTRRGSGIASALLIHLLDDARARGVEQISLETGSMDFFDAARALYRRYGFVECEPFGTYIKDPNSTFMTLNLTGRA